MMILVIWKMEHKDASCQSPEGPILCVNNCGFFGSPTTMNMCSKCHKDVMSRQERASLAASSLNDILNNIGNDSGREPAASGNIAVAVSPSEPVETPCRTPEDPILCINNCGFYGSPKNMNMCSKCHKDTLSKQDGTAPKATAQTSDASASSEVVLKREPEITGNIDVVVGSTKPVVAAQSPDGSTSSELAVPKLKEGPARCHACRKRVGSTGFTCRCGGLFCGMHRYSEKHDCTFDFRASAQDAIAKANPVIRSEKLDKI